MHSSIILYPHHEDPPLSPGSTLNELCAALATRDLLMSISSPISVLVVDDQESVRASIKAALKEDSEIIVIGEASDGVEAVEQVTALSPDVVVMDLAMPFMSGTLAASRIVKNRPSTKVLIISKLDDEDYIRDYMKAGASGYLMKDMLSVELAPAIRVAHSGGHFFSPRVAQRIVGFYLKQVASTDSR